MATQKLTDKSVSAAKAVSGRLELWDEQTPGLCLRVSAGGKRVWVWRYRTLDGRQPRLSLGDYSTKHSLKWAREQVEDLRVQVRKGADPAAERRQAKIVARTEPLRTFDDLADAYVRACEQGHWKPKNKRKRARTISDEVGSLKRHIRPVLGKERIETITRRDVRALLRGMIDKGIGAQTNKAHAVIRQIYAYAMSEERVATNPAVGFLPLATQTARVRVLTDEELKALWAALIDPSDLRAPVTEEGAEAEGVYVSRAVRIILQLSLLLLQRRSEVAGMRLNELDLERGLWLIPAERMKGGVAHMVPLPARSVELIQEALRIGDEAAGRRRAEDDRTPLSSSRPVFPSPRDPAKPVLANSCTHAMRELTDAIGIVGISPHDLRRTGSTALTSERLGVSPFIRSKVLGHRADAGGGAAVSMIHYDANEYLAEKRRALEAWDALLGTITVGSRHAPDAPQ
ncbi:MAG: integrase arm-type DNA-binding domain-containing protein [Phenylobacterium sp.]|uniref:tyrosine-type recombinase/integrase n=1 Tax=Phenylobacterium sp. TaxID=1871053 RepID=UPI002733EED2|nr:integrase arm-type DNA-binding domain-containing protein [Phenylobacterium sp.]MDP3174408.1 integrase arm-type DNA-binding domain-containing protein [Phenylobacterium sp.]